MMAFQNDIHVTHVVCRSEVAGVTETMTDARLFWHSPCDGRLIFLPRQARFSWNGPHLLSELLFTQFRIRRAWLLCCSEKSFLNRNWSRQGSSCPHKALGSIGEQQAVLFYSDKKMVCQDIRSAELCLFTFQRGPSFQATVIFGFECAMCLLLLCLYQSLFTLTSDSSSRSDSCNPRSVLFNNDNLLLMTFGKKQKWTI